MGKTVGQASFLSSEMRGISSFCIMGRDYLALEDERLMRVPSTATEERFTRGK